MDRHFVRQARKKVTPSNEPKRDSTKEIVKAAERTSGRERTEEGGKENDRKGFDLLPQ